MGLNQMEPFQENCQYVACIVLLLHHLLVARRYCLVALSAGDCSNGAPVKLGFALIMTTSPSLATS